jgi:hypothetical protein
MSEANKWTTSSAIKIAHLIDQRGVISDPVPGTAGHVRQEHGDRAGFRNLNDCVKVTCKMAINAQLSEKLRKRAEKPEPEKQQQQWLTEVLVVPLHDPSNLRQPEQFRQPQLPARFDRE